MLVTVSPTDGSCRVFHRTPARRWVTGGSP